MTSLSPEPIQTSTPKSRHREFFEKLYGSLESKKVSKLDSSSSDDSTYKKDEDRKSTEGASSPPIRPFPSFPLPSSLDQTALLAARNLSYFPPSHHHPLTGTFPSGSTPTSSVEAALRFPEFPFPGGLAAFCKFNHNLIYKKTISYTACGPKKWHLV